MAIVNTNNILSYPLQQKDLHKFFFLKKKKDLRKLKT